MFQFTPVPFLNDDGAHDKIKIECADVGHEIDKCFMQEVKYKGSEELISVDVSTMARYQILPIQHPSISFLVYMG